MHVQLHGYVCMPSRTYACTLRPASPCPSLCLYLLAVSRVASFTCAPRHPAVAASARALAAAVTAGKGSICWHQSSDLELFLPTPSELSEPESFSSVFAPRDFHNNNSCRTVTASTLGSLRTVAQGDDAGYTLDLGEWPGEEGVTYLLWYINTRQG